MGLGGKWLAKVSVCAVGLAVGVSGLATATVAEAAPLTFTFKTTLHGQPETYGTGWFTYDPDATQTEDETKWKLIDWEADKIVFWSITGINVVPNSFDFGYSDPTVGALNKTHVAAFHFEDQGPGGSTLFALNVLKGIETTTGNVYHYESFFLSGSTSRSQTGSGTATAPSSPNAFDSYGSSRFIYSDRTGWQPETPGLQTVRKDLDLYFPQPVPEPGSLLLLGTGLLGLARVIRSRFSA